VLPATVPQPTYHFTTLVLEVDVNHLVTILLILPLSELDLYIENYMTCSFLFSEESLYFLHKVFIDIILCISIKLGRNIYPQSKPYISQIYVT
jgi:hypothetical protein